MDLEERPTGRDRYHAKWAIIAALVGAVAAVGLQHLISRDTTSAEPIEVLRSERSQPESLEAPGNRLIEQGEASNRAHSDVSPSLENPRPSRPSGGFEASESNQEDNPSTRLETQPTEVADISASSEFDTDDPTLFDVHVQFRVLPKDTSIFLDSRFIGTAESLSGGALVPSGRHVISLGRTGYEPQKHNILFNQAVMTLQATLTKSPQTTATEPTLPVATNQPVSTSSLQPVATAKEQGFQFDLMGCNDEGSSIRCYVVVTNQLPDRWIWMSSGRDHATFLVDNGGNQCSASDSSFTWGTLIEDVPIRLMFDFQRCPHHIALLKYFQVGFKLGNPAFPKSFKVSFRDIPVSVE